MPLTGGPADKLGNRYELWWTVKELVEMLRGDAESIRIEDPGVTKAEFVVIRQGRRELHQAKRSHVQGKWSLSSLGAPNVQILQAIFSQLVGNDCRFVFVSGSEAKELAELSERSRHATTLQEFTREFIDAREHHKNFDQLRDHWNKADSSIAFDILRRVYVRTIDERSLEDQVRAGLQVLFTSGSDEICSDLRSFAEDSIHQTITRDILNAHLEKRGYRIRRLVNPEAAPTLLREVTEEYLLTARKKLINQSLIKRAATHTLLERINSESRGGDFVLTGKAGVGKTGCVVEFIESLRSTNPTTPILAFRLDRLHAVSTTKKLGEQLGLEESPALVLAAAAVGSDAILIVDQLDAVGTASGRSLEFFEAVDGLLSEVRGLRNRLKLHVVVVCRSFDWENDYHLRRVLSDQPSRIDVGEFTPEDVKSVLTSGRYPIELFKAKQLELLRLPQNLALFIEATYETSRVPKFGNEKELFDSYWETKRKAVGRRAGAVPDRWTDVIETMCDEMTQTQQLSIPLEKLDGFDIAYLNQMTSENVLAFDGKRYAFGHESFFDYCFARHFVAQERSLVDFLTASEQHLFRRAQVRQVLGYLRDADRSRYLKELRAVLTESTVRAHIKDLSLALIASVPDLDNDEWAMLEPWLRTELEAAADGIRNSDRFASLVWDHFFFSPTLFAIADARGFVSEWLSSTNPKIRDTAISYLRVHERHAGDRVAELLEPYANLGEGWTARLRFLMEWAYCEKSRRLFDLTLVLIDNGTLDQARDHFASNGSFWSSYYGLAKERPEWFPELLAHWLRRRLTLIGIQKGGDGEIPWGNFIAQDEFGGEHFHESAAKAPAAFVKHVLPVVLEISDAAIIKDGKGPPNRDSVWQFFVRIENESIHDSCLNALVEALRILAQVQQTDLTSTLVELRRRETLTSNFLLLNFYTGGKDRYADDALTMVTDQPWRLNCGYVDSPYWIARQLISAVSPYCSTEILSKLESVILDFSTDFERSRDGLEYSGMTRFNLLASIPKELRGRKAQKHFGELSRKFGEAWSGPVGSRASFVGSPIEEQSAGRMTDEQWLKAISKYQTNERSNSWKEPWKGGARQLAEILKGRASSEPERFARLCLQFPLTTNPVYIERTLDGLKGTDIETALKLSVCRKAYQENRQECGSSLADLLGSIPDALPDDCVDILHWLATDHPDPVRELWDTKSANGKPYYGGDILLFGTNTTRGRAAEAIRDLITQNSGYIPRFRPTIDRLVEDQSLGVRSIAASIVLSIMRYDPELALHLFHKLVAFDEQVLQTRHSELIIYFGLPEYFTVLEKYITTLLGSPDGKAGEIGARLASLAFLSHHVSPPRGFQDNIVRWVRTILGIRPGEKLVAKAMAGSPFQRKGVAEIAAGQISNPNLRDWCVMRLSKFFDDTSPEVRREAASCFRQLKDVPIEPYEKLILSFCGSRAFEESSFPLFFALEGSVHRLPGITCAVCEKFLQRFSEKAKDVRTHFFSDSLTLTRLIFRTYQHHQRDDWTAPCLDLIDKMCIEGFRDVRSGFEDFER